MKVLLAFLLLPLAGCDLFGSVRTAGKPVSEAYGGTHELRVLDVDSPLRREKKIPVLTTPEVFAAYVPAHAEPDLYFGDRWVFLKLKDSEWMSERLQEPDPPATGEAPPESFRLLREADWTQVVIPYK
jgi:hypothetical protein